LEWHVEFSSIVVMNKVKENTELEVKSLFYKWVTNNYIKIKIIIRIIVINIAE